MTLKHYPQNTILRINEYEGSDITMSAIEGISTTKSGIKPELTPNFLMWVWQALNASRIVEARKGTTHPMPLPTALWVVVLSNGAHKNN